MTAFSDAFLDLMADENFGLAAVYRAGGAGDGVPIRVLRSMPDVRMSWADTIVSAGAVLFWVRAADVAQPAAGDTLTIDGGVFTVLDGAPEFDALRLAHRVSARRQ